jgi:hypothetical protein
MGEANKQADVGFALFAKEQELEEELTFDTDAAQKFKDEADVQIKALQDEAAALTGKENKKARNAKNKKACALKVSEQYIDALKVLKGLAPPKGSFVKKSAAAAAPADLKECTKNGRAEDPSGFGLQISTLDGNVVTVQVIATDTIGDLMQSLEKLLGIPVAQQRLLSDSVRLCKTSTIAACGLDQTSSVTLIKKGSLQLTPCRTTFSTGFEYISLTAEVEKASSSGETVMGVPWTKEYFFRKHLAHDREGFLYNATQALFVLSIGSLKIILVSKDEVTAFLVTGEDEQTILEEEKEIFEGSLQAAADAFAECAAKECMTPDEFADELMNFEAEKGFFGWKAFKMGLSLGCTNRNDISLWSIIELLKGKS